MVNSRGDSAAASEAWTETSSVKSERTRALEAAKHQARTAEFKSLVNIRTDLLTKSRGADNLLVHPAPGRPDVAERLGFGTLVSAGRDTFYGNKQAVAEMRKRSHGGGNFLTHPQGEIEIQRNCILPIFKPTQPEGEIKDGVALTRESWKLGKKLKDGAKGTGPALLAHHGRKKDTANHFCSEYRACFEG